MNASITRKTSIQPGDLLSNHGINEIITIIKKLEDWQVEKVFGLSAINIRILSRTDRMTTDRTGKEPLNAKIILKTKNRGIFIKQAALFMCSTVVVCSLVTPNEFPATYATCR
jgi:hypothetical protein